MKKILSNSILIVLVMFFSLKLHSQNVLYGILKDQDSGALIKDARIWVQGGPVWESTTNDGEFKLNLDIGGFYGVGEKIEILINHQYYGFHKIRIPITIDKRCEISIMQSNIIQIMGTVVDATSLQPVQGIDISLMNENGFNPNMNMPKTKSDDSGNFSVYLRRDIVGSAQYFVATLNDAKGRYKFISKLIKPATHTMIHIERGNYKTKNLKVNSYTQAIKVSLGDRITINANGSIKVGQWVGSSKPEGRDAGVFNLPIDEWSVYREYPHAALLYKYSWESDWHFCGEKTEDITAQNDGYLEFMINDAKLDDNDGAYDVAIRVQ